MVYEHSFLIRSIHNRRRHWTEWRAYAGLWFYEWRQINYSLMALLDAITLSPFFRAWIEEIKWDITASALANHLRITKCKAEVMCNEYRREINNERLRT